MKVVRIGLDIAKTVFQIHGVDQQGKTVLKKTLSRGEVLGFFANTPVRLIGIEACAGSHYWARELIKLGHDARLMAAPLVSPDRKSGKNDAHDAEAICEAVGRPNLRFVPVKSEEAQAVLAVHRVRSLTVSERTARVNQVCGLLGEFGIVVGQGIAQARRLLADIGAGGRQLPILARKPSANDMTACALWTSAFWPTTARYRALAKACEPARRLMAIEGARASGQKCSRNAVARTWRPLPSPPKMHVSSGPCGLAAPNTQQQADAGLVQPIHPNDSRLRIASEMSGWDNGSDRRGRSLITGLAEARPFSE